MFSPVFAQELSLQIELSYHSYRHPGSISHQLVKIDVLRKVHVCIKEYKTCHRDWVDIKACTHSVCVNKISRLA